MAHPPGWMRAAAPVALQMTLLSVGGSVMYLRGLAGITENLPGGMGPGGPLSPALVVTLAVVSVVAGVAVTFWLAAGAMVALDLLFAGSGQARRLVECAALAYWTQVPWSLATVGILLWWFDPEPLRVSSDMSSSELTARMTAYQNDLQSTPLMATTRVVGMYFGLWLAALQAAALRAVSGFSVGGAWAAGILLALLFVGIPYAAQQLW